MTDEERKMLEEINSNLKLVLESMRKLTDGLIKFFDRIERVPRAPLDEE